MPPVFSSGLTQPRSASPMREFYVANHSWERIIVPSGWPTPIVIFADGVCLIGHDGHGFAFDNESPRQRSFLKRFEMAAG
jgi:hypothetical protein